MLRFRSWYWRYCPKFS